MKEIKSLIDNSGRALIFIGIVGLVVILFTILRLLGVKTLD
jgi:hypothetical protein